MSDNGLPVPPLAQQNGAAAERQVLAPKHLADLRASGLTDTTIEAAHIHTLTDADEIGRRLNWNGSAKLGDCLCFPYLDLDGNPNGYAALKPDRPRRDSKKPHKAHKYELPIGKGNRVYIPPDVGPILSDSTVPLIVTEGAKKALKANQEGLPTIGLSGVWNWTTKGRRQLIADLLDVAWKGRKVFIVFDSDAAHNKSVMQAERELAELLRTHGATVRVVRLPGRPDGKKVGLDDYLMIHTADDLRALLDPPQPTPPPRKTLADVVATFRGWLHLPDTAPLELALAAVIANRTKGDPVWLLLVGPPGSGKSEIVSSLAAAAPDIHLVGTLTEASLLSGTSAKDYITGSTGGLLRAMGEFGILAVKDLGSILSMNKDTRAGVLAALREVYDGQWIRHVGADGGKELRWAGKCGLVGGSTPAVDSHYALISALGERFAYLRMPVTGRRDRGLSAAARTGSSAMRAELAAAVSGLLANTTIPDGPPELSDADRERLVALADFTSMCRTQVDRGYTGKEIVNVPPPEEPTRLVIVFRQLQAAFPALGISPDRGWELLVRIAFDSIPPVRRNVLHHLTATTEQVKTSIIARKLGLPTTSVRRALEELHCYKVVELAEEKSRNLNTHNWSASAWTREILALARVPQIRECAYQVGSRDAKDSQPTPSFITQHPVRTNLWNAEQSLENKANTPCDEEANWAETMEREGIEDYGGD